MAALTAETMEIERRGLKGNRSCTKSRFLYQIGIVEGEDPLKIT